MLHWLIAIAGLALVMISVHTWWMERRRRRDRDDFHHLTGARQWWGKR